MEKQTDLDAIRQMMMILREAPMKHKPDKGITIEFINTPKAGTKCKRGLFKQLEELAKLNKANRILIVFDRD